MSNWFAGKWFASKWNEEWYGGVRVPAPVVVGGASGSKSGGWNKLFNLEPERRLRPLHKPFSKAVLKNLVEKLDKPGSKDAPLAPARPDPSASLRYDHNLLKQRHRKALRDLAKAKLEIENLVRDKRFTFGALEEMKTRMAALQRQIVSLENAMKTLEEHSPVSSAIPWFVASGVLGLFTCFVVSDNTLKWLGYSGSLVLAGLGLSSVFSRPRIEIPPVPLPPPPPSGPKLLPLGVVRIR